MLATKFRLKKGRNIEYILKKGKTFSAKTFLAKFLPNEENYHRCTIITSQKFSKKAVDRNRARRRLYEAIRFTSKPHKETGYDYIIIPKKLCMRIHFQILKDDMIQFFTILEKKNV